jgi:hypothetical protein
MPVQTPSLRTSILRMSASSPNHRKRLSLLIPAILVLPLCVHGAVDGDQGTPNVLFDGLDVIVV